MKGIYQRDNQSISLRTFPSNCTVRCLGTCMQWLLYIILWLVSFFWRATSMLEVKWVEQKLNMTGTCRVSISTLFKLTFQTSWTTIGIRHRRWVLFRGALLKSPNTSWTKNNCLEHPWRLGSWWSRDLNCAVLMYVFCWFFQHIWGILASTVLKTWYVPQTCKNLPSLSGSIKVHGSTCDSKKVEFLKSKNPNLHTVSMISHLKNNENLNVSAFFWGDPSPWLWQNHLRWRHHLKGWNWCCGIGQC